MNLFLVIFFVLFGTDLSSSKKTLPTPTLPVQDRVAILKAQIADQINKKHVVVDTIRTAVNEDVEYEDHAAEPITPINEHDPRKKKDRFKLKQIKTTRDIGQNFKSFANERNEPEKTAERNSPIVQKRTKKKNRMIKKSKVTDVFYRRLFEDKCSSQWTHCQDLITPYLTGHKVNMTVRKRVAYDDSVVIRLIQLLTEDITDHTKDDIHSILYQISNLQLRLFQWDVAAIKLLLNVINRDKSKRHSFKLIKNGLKHIFKNWNLNFGSNLRVVMKQTRIFRPPCVKITDNQGSTKTSKGIRYTKSVKKKCKKGDEDYDACVMTTHFG